MPTSLVALLVLLRSLIRSRVDLQQRSLKKRQKITAMDRRFWASLSRIWRDWRSAFAHRQASNRCGLASHGLSIGGLHHEYRWERIAA